MERIKALYATLKQPEKKFLITYLTAFHPKGENKTLELLELIEAPVELSTDEIAEKLYGDSKSKAFIMLKGRLYDKMLEALMLSTNPANPSKDALKEQGFEKTELRKLLIYNFMLRRRGLFSLADEICLKGLKVSREFEYPDIELDFLGTLRTQYAKSHSDKYEQIIQEMDDAFRRYELDMITSNTWNYYRNQFSLRSSIDEARRYLEVAIPKFEENVMKLGSSSARYYLALMKINYFDFTKQFDEGRKEIDVLLHLVHNSKRHNTSQGLGIPYTHLAVLELNRFRLEEALQAADLAAQYNKKNSPNFSIGLFTRAFILLHMGNVEGAEAQIKALEENSMSAGGSSNWAICNYVKACIAFINKDYTLSWKFLQEVSGLNFDKAGWITGIKIFEIMVLIEKGDFDMLTLRLDSLRKHIQKHNSDERANLIYKLLIGQEKDGFTFANPVKKEEEILEELSNNQPWELAGHETIRFEPWYKLKRSQPGISLEHTFKVSLMALPKMRA